MRIYRNPLKVSSCTLAHTLQQNALILLARFAVKYGLKSMNLLSKGYGIFMYIYILNEACIFSVVNCFTYAKVIQNFVRNFVITFKIQN
jgi:hypothetical protein